MAGICSPCWRLSPKLLHCGRGRRLVLTSDAGGTAQLQAARVRHVGSGVRGAEVGGQGPASSRMYQRT